MFGRSKTERMADRAVSAAELAGQLAEDKKFRRRLLSGIQHSSEAARHTRRGLGLAGAVSRLATDETLLRELRGARDDLQQAYGQLQAKRRGHKLRNLTLLAAAASLFGVPQVRKRIAAAFAQTTRQCRRLGKTAKRAGSSNTDEH